MKNNNYRRAMFNTQWAINRIDLAFKYNVWMEVDVNDAYIKRRETLVSIKELLELNSNLDLARIPDILTEQAC